MARETASTSVVPAAGSPGISILTFGWRPSSGTVSRAMLSATASVDAETSDSGTMMSADSSSERRGAGAAFGA